MNHIYQEYLPGAPATPGYDRLIQEATDCAVEEIGGIERVMRDTYPTLDHLTRAQFNRTARTAYRAWKKIVSTICN